MKAEIKEIPKPVFKPVRMVLTFETQAELDALGSLFNATYVTNAIHTHFGVRLRIFKEFAEAGADIHHADTLTGLIIGEKRA